MVFTAWEPSSNELEKYYSNYPAVSDISHVTLSRYDELLNTFGVFRRNGKILDVGCGGGHFLERAKMMNWKVQGTEYGVKPIQACHEKGIPVIEGPLNPADYIAGEFDVICSFEVIEHVVNPAQEVSKMLQLLRPGGLLYLTTPNFNCVARRTAPKTWNVASYPEHLNYFTPKTMHHLLSAKGLKKQWTKTTGISIERWITKHKGQADLKAKAHKTQDDLRATVEANRILRTGKFLANAVLNALSLGDSMKVAYLKQEGVPGTPSIQP